jgi:hypothetical protein
MALRVCAVGLLGSFSGIISALIAFAIDHIEEGVLSAWRIMFLVEGELLSSYWGELSLTVLYLSPFFPFLPPLFSVSYSSPLLLSLRANSQVSLASSSASLSTSGSPIVCLVSLSFVLLKRADPRLAVPDDAPFLTPAERELVIARLPPSANFATDKNFDKSEIVDALKDPLTYAFLGLQLFSGLGTYGLQWYVDVAHSGRVSS